LSSSLGPASRLPCAGEVTADQSAVRDHPAWR
jgi:hypothetical protein